MVDLKELHWFCSDSGHREAFVYHDGKEYSVKMNLMRLTSQKELYRLITLRQQSKKEMEYPI